MTEIDILTIALTIAPLVIPAVLVLVVAGVPIPVGYDRGQVRWLTWCSVGNHLMIVYRWPDGRFQTMHPADSSEAQSSGEQTLRADERGRSIIWVALWLIATLISLWIFTLIYGAVLEPLAEVARDVQAVESEGYLPVVDLSMAALKFAGLLLGIGSILLAIIYAVWQERFIGRRRRPRP